MRWTTRQIEAPAIDTLSAAEVAVMLGYRDAKSVMRLVEEGRFPEPVEEERGRVWFWEDVVWFQLSKRVRPRLKTPPPDPPKPPKKGTGGGQCPA